MGGDVDTNGGAPVDEVIEAGVIFTVDEARLLNGLLNNAGFKGSFGKRIAASAQEKIEAFLPPDEDG